MVRTCMKLNVEMWHIICNVLNFDDDTKKTALGKRRERTLSFEIVIKNNTGSAINLSLEDQIPITKNEDITIKLVDAGDAKHEEKSGMLTWALHLAPGESKAVYFSYSVEHDKNKPIS